MSERPSSRLVRTLGSGLILVSISILSAILCACTPDPSSSRPPGPTRAGRGHVSELQGEARPEAEAALRYGEDRPYALNVVEAAIVEVLLSGAERELSYDPSLSALARDLARVSPSRYDMPPSLVDALMAWHGVIDPPPALLVVELEASHGCHLALEPVCEEAVEALRTEALRTVLERAGAGGAPRWRVGVGVAPVSSGASTRMVVALVERRIVLEPIPVVVPAAGSVQIEGRLLGGRVDPRLERVDPHGKWSRVPAVIGDDGSIEAELRCDAGSGVYQVEVLADGEHGPEVVANFRVFCGVDRPSKIAFHYERLGLEVTVADIVRENFDRLNEAREARGLALLRWDDRAAQVAQAHSADMESAGFVGHVSPTTGDASARFDRAGIVGGVVRENVGRGYGPNGIHESLMNSPGHRANMLAEDVTHVGIGVVFGEPVGTASEAPRPVFLTQNFYAKPGALAPARPRAELRQLVEAARAEAGLSAPRWHRGLGKLAQRRAEAAAGVGPAVSDEDVQDQLRALDMDSLEQHQVSGQFSAFADLELWTELDPGASLGLGVVEAQGGRYILVILVGR